MFHRVTCCYKARIAHILGHRGPRRKVVNMDVILSSLSLMAASLLALVRGIAISYYASSYSSCYVVS